MGLLLNLTQDVSFKQKTIASFWQEIFEPEKSLETIGLFRQLAVQREP